MKSVMNNLRRQFATSVPSVTGNPGASSIPTFSEKIRKLLQPSKVTEGLSSSPKDIPFVLRNGTDHFTLPLQRIVFTYCPHNGDSKPLMEYLHENIVKFAEDNPTVEVVVSCKFASSAKVEAFYNGDFQHRRLVYVGGGKKVTPQDVKIQVDRLRDLSGMKAKKFKVQVVSETPAVRPIYSQFQFSNPRNKSQ